MIQIQAPHPLCEAILTLPDPEFGDAEQLGHTVVPRRMMNNEVTTHVRRAPSKKFNFSFDLTRLKSLELVAFYELYHAGMWRIRRTADTLVGYANMNPMQIAAVKRGATAAGNDVLLSTLEFEVLYAISNT